MVDCCWKLSYQKNNLVAITVVFVSPLHLTRRCGKRDLGIYGSASTGAVWCCWNLWARLKFDIKQEYNSSGVKILWQGTSSVAVGGEFDSARFCRDDIKREIKQRERWRLREEEERLPVNVGLYTHYMFMFLYFTLFLEWLDEYNTHSVQYNGQRSSCVVRSAFVIAKPCREK